MIYAVLVSENGTPGHIYGKRADTGVWEIVHTAQDYVHGLLAAPSNSELVIAQAPFESAGQTILHSTNGGETWAGVAGGHPVGSVGASYGVVMNDTGTAIFAAGTHPVALTEGIHKSTDWGATWSLIYSTPQADQPDARIWAHNGYVWWGRFGGIGRVTDAGTGFVELSGDTELGDPSGGYHSDTLLRRRSFSPPYKVLKNASGAGGFAATTDPPGWSVGLGVAATSMSDAIILASVDAYAPPNPSTYYINRSTDYGVTWSTILTTTLPVAFDGGIEYVLAGQLGSNPSDCWIVLDYPKVYHSIDLGLTWTAHTVTGLSPDANYVWSGIAVLQPMALSRLRSHAHIIS